MKILMIILISYAGMAWAVPDSEYQIANDWNIDTGIACSNSMGAHQFFMNTKRPQWSASWAAVGGQSCMSAAFGKKIGEQLFGHIAVSEIRGDEALTIQMNGLF